VLKLPLEPTDDMIAKATSFAARKYAERVREANPLLARDHPSLVPSDLSGGYKFAALFAQRLFGGVIRGSQHHLWLVCHGKKIDLCANSGLTKAIGKQADFHHPNLLKLKTFHDSLNSCKPRIEQWVNEFLAQLGDEEPLTEDYSFKPEEDTFSPRLMDEPKVLYRSVSLPELEDIFHRYAVVGGGNKFNDFEHRPWVFFADQITDQLIGQGEEIDRQASHMLRSHSVHYEYRRLSEQIQFWANFVKKRLNRLNIEFDEEYWEGLYHGHNYHYFMKFLGQIDNGRQKYADALDEIRRLDNERSELNGVYRTAHKQMAQGLKLMQADRKATSAIIVTKPLKGGLHYSKEFGKSGFQTDEYGFHSGQVKAHDLDQVIFVQHGHRVASCPAWKAQEVLEKIMRPRD
jgi:hypothetical protein